MPVWDFSYLNGANVQASQRILIISSDPLADHLGGVGIRAVEMARHLAPMFSVILAAPERADLIIAGVECVPFETKQPEALYAVAKETDILIVQGYALFHYPMLKELNKILIVDMYDPFHLESLEMERSRGTESAREQAELNAFILNEQLMAGDFFLCASERQRDFWLGALGSINRLSPEIYRADQTFRSLIDVVSFGTVPDSPVHRQQVLKGVFDGIDNDDIVVLWGGGIWDWLDPLTVIQAMKLLEDQPKIKLFFMGRNHPNSSVIAKMPMYDRAVELAQTLGVYQRTVFFNHDWVAYAERENYLLESDIGVSSHLEHVETRFAFRTRLLDYIWAGLPMIVSAGDTLADTVQSFGLGIVVDSGDVQGFAHAIRQLATTPRSAFNAAFRQAQQQFSWKQTLQPLINFCLHPHHALDQERELSDQLARLTPDYSAIYQHAHQLEKIVTEKNVHILYLENHIKQIEHGRIMRGLNWINRFWRKNP